MKSLLLIVVMMSVSSTVRALEPPVLRAPLETEPVTLDWNAAQTPTDRFILSFLMRGLMKYDASNAPVCDLCRAHTVTGAGRVWRFELVAGTKWSDGVALEPRHFVDGFER